MRTIPSDKNQAEVMVELVKLFNWTYVSIVYEESSYGQEVCALDTAYENVVSTIYIVWAMKSEFQYEIGIHVVQLL